VSRCTRAKAGAKSLESKNALPPVSVDSVDITSCEAKFAFMLVVSAAPLKPALPRRLPVDASPSGPIASRPRVSTL